ncbi:MAG: hypothetical protein HY088_01605 [Ignavibacteriales bacterium]|nr:hypothetical protein [Ignavibacteriales bacterium]
MNYESLSLQAIYETIRRIHVNKVSEPQIPRRGTPQYQEYSGTATHLIRNIPGDKAVYLWFAKQVSGVVEYIYVGESHKNKDGLRGRFADEFKQWYHIFWMTTYKSDKYEHEVIEMYRTPTKDYTKEVTNQSLKRGATHIVFCSHNSDRFDPVDVQNDLIQLFGNPRGNAKDKRKSPLPDHELLPISQEIFTEFKRIIDEMVPYSI